jgi:hypothetical protein
MPFVIDKTSGLSDRPVTARIAKGRDIAEFCPIKCCAMDSVVEKQKNKRPKPINGLC